MRLISGIDGTGGRRLDLAPESFASGPTGGRILVGEDDGSVSRLSLLDAARGCRTALADEASVIRSAVASPDGRSLYEHRVDRRTRQDLGVWRRGLDADGTAEGAAERVLAGIGEDPDLGRTFFTDLVAAGDGRLVVSSCGAQACRVRVLDPDTGQTALVAGTGPAVGVTGRRLVVRDACAGWPCAVTSVDLVTGRRATLIDAAWAATLGGSLDVQLVYEADGSVGAIEVATGRRTAPIEAGAVPLRSGSTATGGAEAAGATVALAPGGRADGIGLRAFDPARGIAIEIGEVER
jgi:hypothetical protein